MTQNLQVISPCTFVKTTAVAFALGLSGFAAEASQPYTSTIVNIDAAVTGCTNYAYCGGQHLAPGVLLQADLLAPTSVTLDAGTYTITNGSGEVGANPNFTSWNYNTGGDNWVWAFMAIDHATKIVVVEGCCGQLFTTKAGAASQAFAQNYSTTFTLASTTTLDFITEDYIPGDNAGGVALKITGGVAPVPEPETLAMLLAGLGVVGYAVRRKRLSPAQAT